METLGDGPDGVGGGVGGLQAAVELLKGPAGSRVRLTVVRRDDGLGRLAIHRCVYRAAVVYHDLVGLWLVGHPSHTLSVQLAGST